MTDRMELDGRPGSARHTRVIVADDHPIVRAGIIHELSRHPAIAVLGEASNADQALQMVCELQPDVLLLDISMPGTPVLEIIRLLGGSSQAVRVLMLTAHNDPDTVLAMLKAGAAGYILKDEDVAEITVAALAVARGERWISPQITAMLVNQALCRTDEPQEETLSAREIEVLQHLAEGKDNLAIGATLCISERTVRFHLRNIYDKLGVRRGGAIAWGIRNGLVTFANPHSSGSRMWGREVLPS